MLDVFKNLTYQVLSPKASARARYETFRKLLANDQLAHEYLAEIEEIYQQPPRRDINYINGQYTKLAQAVSTMVSCLIHLAPDAATNLRAYYKKIDFYCRFALAPPEIDTSPPFLLPLKGRYQDDLQVGGKAFHLTQLKTDLNLPVPEGFIISTAAYQLFLQENGLHEKIASILAGIDIFVHDSLHSASSQLCALIDKAVFPAPLKKAMDQACEDLQKKRGKDILLAVRSSAVGEDSTTSFAGQYSSILDTDCRALSQAYREVVRSKFSPEALYYRTRHGFHDHSTPMAVMVLEMIDADFSGVIDNNQDKSLSIHVVKGQGAGLMAGDKSPEITLNVKNGTIQPSSTKEELLSQKQIRKLSDWADQITYFYQAPQEIEWCRDPKGNFFILQSRFLPTQPHNKPIKKTDMPPPLFTGGEAASQGTACGKVFILKDLNKTDEVPDKAVLITETIPPALSLICHKLTAVIAAKGSVASHFSSVAREFNIPTLVKTGPLKEIFSTGQEVTLHAEDHAVYAGRIDDLLEKNKATNDEKKNPLKKNMEILISFISPLRLIEPTAASFSADSCRSFHDIIRFCHEKGLQAMFGLGTKKPLRKGGARLLRSKLPLQLYLLDIDDGLSKESKGKKEINIGDLRSRPLLALWEGLSHPEIKWRDRDHFDWGACDEIIMAGGVVNPKSIIFASYGVISRDYLNLNMRFGYHFAILDCLCGDKQIENYITLRFAGGGGGMDGKTYRLMMIKRLLGHFGFIIERKGDLLDARLTGYDRIGIMEAMEICGRLLGATRLMDMILRNEEMVNQSVTEFLDGRYDFSNE